MAFRSSLGVVLAAGVVVASGGLVDTAIAGPGNQKFSVDFGLSFPSPDHETGGSSGGTPLFGDSRSNGSTVTSVGIDYRVRLDYLVNGTVNGASGQVTPPFTPLGPVGGAWGRVFLGGDDQNEVKFDYHSNPNGNDTFSHYSRDFFFLPYLGYEFSLGEIGGRPASTTIFAGPRIEQRKVKLMTNELGTWSSFSDTQTDLGFTFGFDIDFALWALFNIGNIANVGNVGNTSIEPFFRIGAALDYNPKISVSGRSIGQSIDYDDEIESSFEPRFFLGLGVKF